MVIAESLMASCYLRQVGWKQRRSNSELNQPSFAVMAVGKKSYWTLK